MTYPAERPPLFWSEPTWTPPVRPWLLTSDRVAGRLSDGQISWWPWHLFVGCQIDLNAGREYVALDTLGGPAMVWTGPGEVPGVYRAGRRVTINWSAFVASTFDAA